MTPSPLRFQGCRKNRKIPKKLTPEICILKFLVLNMSVRDELARVGDDPTVGLNRSEGGTDKAAELTKGMDGTQRFAW
jgi:hypothetical protein